jgi:hypothetical protein
LVSLGHRDLSFFHGLTESLNFYLLTFSLNAHSQPGFVRSMSVTVSHAQAVLNPHRIPQGGHLADLRPALIVVRQTEFASREVVEAMKAAAGKNHWRQLETVVEGTRELDQVVDVALTVAPLTTQPNLAGFGPGLLVAIDGHLTQALEAGSRIAEIVREHTTWEHLKYMPRRFRYSPDDLETA